MIDLTQRDFVWDSALEPVGMDTFDKEPFTAWWERNQGKLSHLHPQICEQWVYRHWNHSHYSFLPLEKLSWRLEDWKTEEILNQTGIFDQGLISDEGHTYCSPAFDYEMIQNEYEPSRTMDITGTWNIPILVLHSPSGFIFEKGPRPDVRYWLIEGHKRIRYLNALVHHGKPSATHFLYLLRL